MKKLGPIMALAAAALAIGAGSAGAYPPSPPPFLGLDPPTVAPGATFSATFVGCDLAGETVSFEVAGTIVSTTCVIECSFPCRGGGGPTDFVQLARARLIAPAATGTYTVTATGLTSGATASATLTVLAAAPTTPGGALPATGSGTAPVAHVAGGLVAVGGGLLVVAVVRSRKAAA